MPELVSVVEALATDVIEVTESRGIGDTEDTEFTIPGYSVFRAHCRGGHRGGGVLLLVNSGFNAVEVQLVTDSQIRYGVNLKPETARNF